jgi:hypothetical protein
VIFFFEVAQQIKYVYNPEYLPSRGDTKTIYITLDKRQQYYWTGVAYLPYNGSITRFENIVLSDTEFKKTFWLDFPEESNASDIANQKINIVFPDVDIQAEISVCLQADLFTSGSISKEYSISKAKYEYDFLSNSSRNSPITHNEIVSNFALSEMSISSEETQIFFSVSNKMATQSKRVKVEVHYKARVKNDIASEGFLTQYIFDNLTAIPVYLSSLYIPLNNETKPSLPLDDVPLGLNNVMIHPLTKELKESPPLTSMVRISKEIDFKDNQYLYMGSKAGDFLDVPDTTNKLFSQIVPSNNLISFINGGVLKNVRIISSDYNVEIKLYLFSVSQVITSSGLQTTLSTPRLVLDCGSGIANYGFALNPTRNVGGGEILMITVKSKIATPRKVVLEGVISFLNL